MSDRINARIVRKCPDSEAWVAEDWTGREFIIDLEMRAFATLSDDETEVVFDADTAGVVVDPDIDSRIVIDVDDKLRPLLWVHRCNFDKKYSRTRLISMREKGRRRLRGQFAS